MSARVVPAAIVGCSGVIAIDTICFDGGGIDAWLPPHAASPAITNTSRRIGGIMAAMRRFDHEL